MSKELFENIDLVINGHVQRIAIPGQYVVYIEPDTDGKVYVQNFVTNQKYTIVPL